MNKNLFFVLEGLDGSGKSTQIITLNQKLQERGYPTHLTREPCDLVIGKMVREILGGERVMDPRVIAALFVADRLDHILDPEDGMLTHLNKGEIVLCDRYYFSSYAYNGVDMPMDWVIEANSQAANLLCPTATLFLDIEPIEAMRRITTNRGKFELFENSERLTQVRENYLRAFDRLKSQETIEIIDGNGTQDQVAERIWQVVEGYL